MVSASYRKEENVAAARSPGRRGQARSLTADECATVLSTCLRPRRTGRGLERPKTAERRGLVYGAIRAVVMAVASSILAMTSSDSGSAT